MKNNLMGEREDIKRGYEMLEIANINFSSS
jgi:hypothetical protein